MPIDGYGPDSAGPAGYAEAVTQLPAFQPGVLDATEALVNEHPDAAPAQVMRAYLGLMSTEADGARAARAGFLPWLAATNLADLYSRERAHVAAVAAWLDGDMATAGTTLRGLSRLWPQDPLRVRAGGDRRLRACRGGRPGGGGAAATDVWAIHAVVHTYEMRGRFGSGVRYLDERHDDWTSGNLAGPGTAGRTGRRPGVGRGGPGAGGAGGKGVRARAGPGPGRLTARAIRHNGPVLRPRRRRRSPGGWWVRLLHRT